MQRAIFYLNILSLPSILLLSHAYSSICDAIIPSGALTQSFAEIDHNIMIISKIATFLQS